MGAVAAQLADTVTVTDDNPRTEESNAIRSEILAGAPMASNIGDRAVAIRQALQNVQPGDLLVVAGKGHETGQILGDRTIEFDDRLEISKAASELRLT